MIGIDDLDRSLIVGYMTLQAKQRRQVRRMATIKRNFWMQSFVHCPQNVDEIGNSLNPPSYDKQIDAILDLTALIDENRRVLAFKQHYWQKYLNRLKPSERAYLVAKYRTQIDIPDDTSVDVTTLNECNQIEEATGHRFDLLADNAVDLSPDADIDTLMNRVLGMIG